MSVARQVGPVAARERLSEAGRQLLAIIEALDRPFGLERSAKLNAKGVNTDRFLASMHKTTLPGGSRRGLERVARQMGLSGPGLDRLLEHVEAADIVHFGHEGGERPVRKIYLEFANAVRAARSAGKSRDVVVHESLKWPHGDPRRAVTTRYIWPARVRDAAAVETRLQRWGGDAVQPSARLALETLRMARERTDQVFYLDVVEEGTERRSFDINLYAAGLTVAGIRPALDRLTDEYGISRSELDALARHSASSALGHVSGGLDRAGRDFATVYFGVEARDGSNHA